MQRFSLNANNTTGNEENEKQVLALVVQPRLDYIDKKHKSINDYLLSVQNKLVNDIKPHTTFAKLKEEVTGVKSKVKMRVVEYLENTKIDDIVWTLALFHEIYPIGKVLSWNN